MALQNLADVIKGSQLNQPISVQPKNAEGKYVINIGERRWRACKLAGLATVPVMISDKTDRYDQVTENTEREPLTTMEIAEFIARRVEEGDKKVTSPSVWVCAQIQSLSTWRWPQLRRSFRTSAMTRR